MWQKHTFCHMENRTRDLGTNCVAHQILPFSLGCDDMKSPDVQCQKK